MVRWNEQVKVDSFFMRSFSVSSDYSRSLVDKIPKVTVTSEAVVIHLNAVNCVNLGLLPDFIKSRVNPLLFLMKKKLSANALSQQLPLRLMLPISPCSAV